MKEYWRLLGCEPTTEIRVLKKAYSQALRQNPPDKDPVAFQRLREAYEALLNQLQFLAAHPELSEPQDSAETETEKTPEYTQSSQADFQDEPVAVEPSAQEPLSAEESDHEAQQRILLQQQLEAMLAQWIRLLATPESRTAAAMKAFFAQEAFWNLQFKSLFEFHLLLDLLQRFQQDELKRHFFSETVWQFLDGYFDWAVRDRQLQRQFPHSFVSLLLEPAIPPAQDQRYEELHQEPEAQGWRPSWHFIILALVFIRACSSFTQSKNEYRAPEYIPYNTYPENTASDIPVIGEFPDDSDTTVADSVSDGK